MTEILSSGLIGDVVSARGQFGFALTTDRDAGRLTRNELGGGALLDIGIYLISFIFAIFKSQIPKSVKASSILFNDVDWHTNVVLGYEKGFATIECGFDSAFYENEILVTGSAGSLKICDPFFAPRKLIVKSKQNGEEVFEFETPPKGDVAWNFGESVSLFHEVQYAEEAIHSGKLESSVLSLDESLEIMKVIDEVRKQIGLTFESDK